MLSREGKPMMSVTATRTTEIDDKLKTWIEELLPERGVADGAQPLDLDELEIALGASNDRGARKQRKRRAA
jgi:hypothetical protein